MQSKLFTALALSLLVACGSDEETPNDANGDTVTLEWELEGLARLGDDFVYEGWVIIDDAPVSTGRFNVDDDGEPEVVSYEISDADLSAATAFVLSIEPAVGDDPAPAATKILGGDLADGVGELSIDHPAALGDDLSDASGSYILETPTTNAIADDYAQGIWWLDMSAGPGPSLDLPELPDGWVYEGWVVTGDGPISTGRFTAVDDADSDGAGATAGPDDAPPFPGQDFIDPAIDLVGATVVISIEPEPDDSDAPFLLKPLLHDMVADVGAGALQDMVNQSASNNPVGSVWPLSE